MKRTSLSLMLLVIGCGNTEIIAPLPLSVIDSDPGNGSLVAAETKEVVLLFSEAVDLVSLETALTLEQTTEAGSPIREVSVTFNSLAVETNAAKYVTEPLPGASNFQLTVRAEKVQASSGARLATDFVRRFRTTQ